MTKRSQPKKSVSQKSKQQFWGDRLKEAPEMRNIAYCAGRDVAIRPMADAVLAPFDCWQNRVHSAMLAQQKIISTATAVKIRKAVTEFEERLASGKLTLNPAKEDSHTNIEHFVAETAGAAVSGPMHTARSRNDQTATVTRMFVRDRLLRFGADVADLIDVLADTAAKYTKVPLAGYTHYQPGSITTVGHWFGSYVQALTRDLERIWASCDRLNVSPLGAAAAFGSSWPIDREFTARNLGFRDVQANTLDCITNRWEMEADAASAVAFTMTHLSIIAQDLVILSVPDTGIVEIADRYVTGSSIMPQKRNPDFAEVTRAKSAVVQSQLSALFGIARGLFSGYNRDTQWTKYLIIDLLDEAADAPAIFAGVFKTLTVNEERAEQSAQRNFVNAVDVADMLAQESGLPFRTTYEIASKAVKLSESKGYIDSAVVNQLAREAGAKSVKLDVDNPHKIAARKTHTGGTAPEAVRKNLASLKKQAAVVRKSMEALLTHLEKCRANSITGKWI